MGEEKNIIGQLFINGRPLTVIKEIEFTDDTPRSEVVHPEPSTVCLTWDIEPIDVEAMSALFGDLDIAYKLLAMALGRIPIWIPRRRRRCAQPRIPNRTRRKQRLTRLQRRRKRQNKNKTNKR